jgi:hypothetical protein
MHTLHGSDFDGMLERPFVIARNFPEVMAGAVVSGTTMGC